MLDYYRILEVDRDASIEVIDKAHKALSMKYHPDRQPALSRESATDRMKLMNEAYAVLSDPNKRALYDRELSAEPWRVFYNEGLLGLLARYAREGRVRRV